MIRQHITRLTAILVTLVTLALALSMTAPTVAEAKRKPTRTPIPPPTATPAPQLPAPTLLSPPNGATVGLGPLTWKWSEVPGATCYSFEAGSSPDFDQTGAFLSQGCLTDTSFTINVDEGFIFYVPYLYWRVRARDANNVGGLWSEVWKLNFAAP